MSVLFSLQLRLRILCPKLEKDFFFLFRSSSTEFHLKPILVTGKYRRSQDVTRLEKVQQI